MQIIKDWSKVDFSNPQHRLMLFGNPHKDYRDIGVVGHFMQAPARIAKMQAQMQAQMQAFGGPGDFPTRINEIFEKFHVTTMYDNAWEQIFKLLDFTGTNEAGWDIVAVEDGLTFRRVPIGDKAEIYKMAGGKASIGFDTYGAGLGWNRTLIDDKKWWTLEDNAIAFRNKYYADKAAVFYALIEAISVAQNIAWQAPDPAALANTNETYTANRDAQTLNLAAQTIIGHIKDRGYGITLSTPFIVLTPYQLMGRISKALNVLLQATPGSALQAAYKFTAIGTTMLSPATSYYVCVPGISAQAGNRMDLTIFTKFDEESYTDFAVGWGRYGGAIGDEEQFQRCAIS